MPEFVAGTKPNTGANAEGITVHIGITCGVQAPTLLAVIGVAGVPIVSSPLSPRSRLPRRMPCGTTVILRSRVQIPPRPTRRVAQSGRAQGRVANPLSPGPYWRVAQLVEQRVLVPWVEGSSPSPPARNTPGECRADYRSNLCGSAQILVPRT